MNNTFILLARSLLDSEVFASQKMLKIWIWCLLRANFKERKVPLKVGKGERTITVKRGQFLFGRFRAEEELFIDGSTIYKIMKKLEELGNIKIESNNQYSIVTINNYDTYQDPKTYKEQPKSSRVTAEEQPSNTDNKENKGNKDKNNISVRQFYDIEIEKTDDQQYHNYVAFLFGENEIKTPLTKLLRWEQQIDYEKFCNLREASRLSGRKIKDTTLALYNSSRSYKTFYLTLLNWIKKD